MGVQKRFNSFSGVFVPTFLSIIGVILFLRLGYVVGHAGVIGSILIILLSVSITLATGLSLSSITTNIRIGSGGAYSIVSKKLGLEVGGALGIPLYLAQVFSVVIYILGFSEAWVSMFPGHSQLLVSLLAFILIFVLLIISTRLAIRVQIGVFIIVIISLLSILFGQTWVNNLSQSVEIWNFAQIPFWSLFALFFPAVTGLMAGVGMSGELTDPKRQIPKGLLWAIGITTIIYILIAVWFGYSAPASMLIRDSTVIVKFSFIPLAVLGGILAATFSSALTTFVAAPRVLLSMAEHSILPFSKFFSTTTQKGEPRNSTIFTAIFILVIIFFGTINAIAPILTMFFLLTYIMINLVVFIEKSLGIVNFRPSLMVSRVVSLYGLFASFMCMLMINPLACIVAIVSMISIYTILIHRKLTPKEGDVRSGLFIGISEWASKVISTLPESSKYVWKPSILLPVVSSKTLLSNFPLIKDIAFPNGTMAALGYNIRDVQSAPKEEKMTKKKMTEELKELPQIVEKFEDDGIFTSSSIVNVSDYTRGICITMEALGSNVFKHNIVFLPFKANQIPISKLRSILDTAIDQKVGVIIFDEEKKLGTGSEKDVHVWIHPRNIKKGLFAEKEFDLSLLIAYKLYKNWKGNITLWMCVQRRNEKEAKKYLDNLMYEARLPQNTKINVEIGTFDKVLQKAPPGDIHIMPITITYQIEHILNMSRNHDKSFLFIMDSGREDILA